MMVVIVTIIDRRRHYYRGSRSGLACFFQDRVAVDPSSGSSAVGGWSAQEHRSCLACFFIPSRSMGGAGNMSVPSDAWDGSISRRGLELMRALTKTVLWRGS